MNTIYILNYNNYYNRILKKEDSIRAYADYEVYITSNVNFNANDGIDAEHVIGVGDYTGGGDYVVVTNSNNEIISRWFIVENQRTRSGQYRLVLRRDVLADYMDNVLVSPCFIEKGFVGIENNLIFNNEDMSYNKIKTQEYPLVDETNTSWIVGYYAKELQDKTIQFIPSAPFDFAVEELSDFDGYDLRQGQEFVKVYTKINYKFVFKPASTSTTNHTFTVSQDGQTVSAITNESTSSTNTSYRLTTANYQIYARDEIVNNYITNWYNGDGYSIFKTDKEKLSKYNQFKGKVLRVGTVSTGYTYYRIDGIEEEVRNQVEEVSDIADYRFYDLTIGASKYLTSNTSKPNRKGIYGVNSYKKRYFQFVDITNSYSSYTVTLPAQAQKLQDAPYNMFCFPLSRLTVDDVEYNSSELGLSLAQAIFTGLGSVVYDIQLLPYCPIPDITLTDKSENVDFVYVKDQEENILTLIYFPQASSFSKQIQININVPTDPIEFKVAGECDMYRLCSNNYNGVFEFSATKNNGISFVEVNCTYKPYTPYIHLNPNFGRLYGGDYNDARGLICGGDFSIAAVTSAWTEYELQNKNYQKIFDRQIVNMEVNNNVARSKEVFNAITGTLGAAGTGYEIGGTTGMFGATAISAIGGALDIGMNDYLRGEAIDFRKDQFGYNLGNIQALPYSLSKSSAFDVNTKRFPFIEYYTCTDEEKEALRNKIKYNGMTVMVIGKLQDFIPNNNNNYYVKGKLIRVEGLEDNYRVVNALSGEVNKGFYINGGYRN